jgi:hypothetical protein
MMADLRHPAHEGRSTANVSPSVARGVGAGSLPVPRRGKCGSPLFAELNAMPSVALGEAGTLGDPSWVQPQANVRRGSALNRAATDEAPRSEATLRAQS